MFITDRLQQGDPFPTREQFRRRPRNGGSPERGKLIVDGERVLQSPLFAETAREPHQRGGTYSVIPAQCKLSVDRFGTVTVFFAILVPLRGSEQFGEGRILRRKGRKKKQPAVLTTNSPGGVEGNAGGVRREVRRNALGKRPQRLFPDGEPAVQLTADQACGTVKSLAGSALFEGGVLPDHVPSEAG